MRIGLIAPPWVPVPPPAYGGTEVVIDNLARGLQELGNEVRLFTVGESQCPVPTDYLYPKAIAPIGVTVPETAHALAAYESLADMDIIHDHTFLGPLISGLRGHAQAAGRAHQPRPVHRRDAAGAQPRSPSTRRSWRSRSPRPIRPKCTAEPRSPESSITASTSTSTRQVLAAAAT